MFPIKFPSIWEMYKKAEASFWTGEAMVMSSRASLPFTCPLPGDCITSLFLPPNASNTAMCVPPLSSTRS
jgi:hypothetical protein